MPDCLKVECDYARERGGRGRARQTDRKRNGETENRVAFLRTSGFNRMCGSEGSGRCSLTKKKRTSAPSDSLNNDVHLHGTPSCRPTLRRLDPTLMLRPHRTSSG